MLDDANRAVLAQLIAVGGGPLHEMTAFEARAAVAQMSHARPTPEGESVPEMAEVRTARVAVSGGEVPVRILIPHLPADGLIVYYHGGGWVLETPAETEAVGRVLAQRTGCAVVLVDYRLAPEYRFPTAADDAYAAAIWAADRLDEIAGATVPMIVAGDSVGGNLAAVVAARARSLARLRLALQVLIYPVTDCDFASGSYRDPENQLIVSHETMAWFWDQYAPLPAARIHPDASPLRAGSVAGLPPAVVITAEHDVLRDEGELYATRLVKAGVPVRHRRFDGQMHGFFSMLGVLPQSGQAMTYVVDAIAAALGSGAGTRPDLDPAGRADQPTHMVREVGSSVSQQM